MLASVAYGILLYASNYNVSPSNWWLTWRNPPVLSSTFRSLFWIICAGMKWLGRGHIPLVGVSSHWTWTRITLDYWFPDNCRNLPGNKICLLQRRPPVFLENIILSMSISNRTEYRRRSDHWSLRSSRDDFFPCKEINTTHIRHPNCLKNSPLKKKNSWIIQHNNF